MGSVGGRRAIMQWQVHATYVDLAVFTCGIEAHNYDSAMDLAIERSPHGIAYIELTPIIPKRERRKIYD